MCFITDAAKLENTLAEMTVYADLEDTAILSVKFHMNPVNDYKVTWSMGDSKIQDHDVSNTVTGKHVQSTYSISDVTKQQLGNYTVQVINQAIRSKHDEAKFIVVLKLKGERNRTMKFVILQHIFVWLTVLRYDADKTN